MFQAQLNQHSSHVLRNIYDVWCKIVYLPSLAFDRFLQLNGTY